MEHAFAVVNAGKPVPLLTLALVGETLYDLAKPREQFVKINSRRLCETLVGALVERLAVSAIFAPKG